MKKLIILGFTSLLICSSCRKKEELSNEVAITGTIENHDESVLMIYDLLGKSSGEDEIAVNDNAFSFNYNIDRPAIAMLVYNDTRKDIFLEPGKSLEVSFDAINIDSTFRYGGELALENSILDSVSGKFRNIDYTYVYSQPLEIIERYMDSIKKDCKQHFKSLLTNHKTTAVFEEYTDAFIDYNMAYIKIILGEYEDEQPEGYYNFLNELSLERATLLDIPQYRLFLTFYIDKETNKRYKGLDSIKRQAPDAKLYESLKVIEDLKNDDVRAYSLYNAMIMQLNEYGITNFDKHYNYFKTHNVDANYTEKMKLAYEEKKRIAPGQPSPQFTLTDIDGNQVALNDFKGKYVYIDFWLTTCPRAEVERPFLLDLQSDYKDEDIVFISISLDKNKDEWTNFVQEKRNTEISLRSGLNDPVAKNYQIYGTPWFTIIDKEGNIFDPVAAKPSSKEIRETLDELLKD